jgi:hypothetical protein
MSMDGGTETLGAFTVQMGLLDGQIDHVSVTYPALGNNLVGKSLHIESTPLEHSHFHAAFLIEMHVQRRLGKVVVLVKIACQRFGNSRASWS